MTGRDLFREIGEISEEYVIEAERYQGRKKAAITPVIRRTLTAAACFVMCIGLVFTVQKMGIMQDSATESIREECATEMQMNMYVESSAAAMTNDRLEMAVGELGKETVSKMESAKEEYVEADSIGENIAAATESLNENAYIINYIEVVSGQEVWDAFLEAVKMRQNAQVQIIQYSLFGEPTVYNLRFENERYYLQIEKTREWIADEKVTETEYSALEKFEQKLSDGKNAITYWLREGEEKFTLIYIEE